MARVALALILAFVVIGISNGYEFRSAKDYVTRMYKKASSFVVNQEEEPTTDDSLGPVKCDEDGLFPNPARCDSYIKCTNGVYYILPCGNDKHFNEETRRCEDRCSAHCDDSLACECDWDSCQTPSDLFAETTFAPTEESTGIPGRRSKKALQFTCSRDGLYPYPYDCDSYIQCSNGQAYTMPCPPGLHFNKMSQRCESPCDARCDPTLADQCGWDDSMEFHSVRQPLYDFTCIKDGLYRNPEECGTYIQCSNGNAYVMACPDRLHFSEETERCEAPCDARCDPSIAEECGWEVTTTPSYSSDVCTLPRYKGPCDAYMTRHYYDSSDGKCKKFVFGGCRSNGNNFRTKEECLRTCVYTMKKQPVSDFRCSRDGLHPNPEDCSSYIQCSNGQDYVMPCPENLHFSRETLRCESPCDAKCDPSVADECGPESKSEEDSDIDCEIEPDAGHCEDRLRRYYYNRENGRCTLFYYGGCGGNSNNFRTLKECQKKCQTQLIGGFRCPAYMGNFGHYPDCMTYYQCKRGIPTLKRCPKGTAFHHKKAKCVSEHEAVCVYVCRESDAVYPVEEDCHRYIDCVNGVSKLEKCPRGLAFDPEKENCVEEETVSCARR